MSRKGRRGRGNKSSSIAPARSAGGEQAVELREEAAVEQAVQASALEQALTADTPPVVSTQREEEPPEVPPPAPVKAAPTVIDRDDSSYPPVDLDNHFFDADGHARHSEPPLETEEHDPRMVLKLTPEVAQRRANLQKYVKIAVGAACALCLAAVVKVTLARGTHDDAGSHAMNAAAATPPPALEPVKAAAPPVETQAAPPPPAPPPAETAAPAVPPPAETTTAAAAPAPAPTDTAQAAAAPAPAATDTAQPTEPDPKAAAKEKNASRSALERGKLADAIEAGEKSVALDPTDAEAWLILGASYQEKGDMKNARRSYKACLEQGKRGPKYECAAMPH